MARILKFILLIYFPVFIFASCIIADFDKRDQRVVNQSEVKMTEYEDADIEDINETMDETVQFNEYDFESYPKPERFQRGINFSGLEAPYEGQWGMVLHEDYFEIVKEAGFDHIRIPIQWINKASPLPPYRINSHFFKRVDWAVNQVLSRGMTAIINIHHFNEIMEDPENNRERFLALWKQIAEHYKDYPDNLYFELLNEPVGRLYSDTWNAYIKDALGIIRETNPERIVVIGPVKANSYLRLNALDVPKDKNILVTIHYYDPFKFTHQGADWAAGVDETGVLWSGTDEEKQEITKALEMAAKWAEEKGVKLWLGEFGTLDTGDIASRARWTEHIVNEAERLNIAWCYWEFGSNFGAYNRMSEKWYPELYKALKGK